MQLNDEIDLAWELAEAARPYLSAVERNDVHVAIGVGEPFAAIRYLINSAAENRIGVTADLVHRCTSWLDAYAGHEAERHLRGRVEQVLAPSAIAGWKSADSRRSANHVGRRSQRPTDPDGFRRRNRRCATVAELGPIRSH
jgi:hypothetical protein